MGITDEVEIELYCPYCGKKLPEKYFQTKDLHPNMNRYTIVQALVELKKMGGGWLHLFFCCKNCNRSGYIDISDYNWKLSKDIQEVLDETQEKLEIIENKYISEEEEKK